MTLADDDFKIPSDWILRRVAGPDDVCPGCGRIMRDLRDQSFHVAEVDADGQCYRFNKRDFRCLKADHDDR